MHPAHLDEGQDGVDDRLLVLEATLLAQDVAQEVHQAAVLGGELEAQRTDSLDHDHLEVICRAASCMPMPGASFIQFKTRMSLQCICMREHEGGALSIALGALCPEHSEDHVACAD